MNKYLQLLIKKSIVRDELFVFNIKCAVSMNVTELGLSLCLE